MRKPIILASLTMIAIWWIAIYRFGWWGAVGCLTFGIITTLLIEWKR